MTGHVSEAIHSEPVWRDRSDFIIGAGIAGGSDTMTEQLWARRVDEHRFEICCIPFFIYDVALGDIVATSPTGDRRYMVTKVVEPSGRYVFRVWFGESFHPRDEIVDDLKALGSLIEWSSSNLLAVDAIDQEHAQLVADLLADREKAGHLIYETGRF